MHEFSSTRKSIMLGKLQYLSVIAFGCNDPMVHVSCEWKRECIDVLGTFWRTLTADVASVELMTGTSDSLTCNTSPSTSSISSLTAGLDELCSNILSYSSSLNLCFDNAAYLGPDPSMGFAYRAGNVERVILPRTDDILIEKDHLETSYQGTVFALERAAYWTGARTEIHGTLAVQIEIQSENSLEIAREGIVKLSPRRAQEYIGNATGIDLTVEPCDVDHCPSYANVIMIRASVDGKPISVNNLYGHKILLSLQEITGWINPDNAVLVFWNGDYVIDKRRGSALVTLGALLLCAAGGFGVYYVFKAYYRKHAE
jgi:hypothetical protein